MVKHLRRLLAATLFLSSSIPALSQAATVQTPLEKILSHFDVALNGIGVFNGSQTGTTGSNVLPANNITQSGSNTLGVLFNIRASKSQWIGGEFNYGYARFTQAYDSPPATPPNTTCCNPTFSAQANAHEVTLGYLIRPDHTLLGAKPYAAVGAGTIAFSPTKLGGLGLLTQARAVYYYHVGVDAPVFGPNAGIRLGFRQLFYLGPDFGQNYITIKKHTITSEPVIGFYYHF